MELGRRLVVKEGDSSAHPEQYGGNAVQGFVRRAKCSYVIRQGSLSEDLSSPIQ